MNANFKSNPPLFPLFPDSTPHLALAVNLHFSAILSTRNPCIALGAWFV